MTGITLSAYAFTYDYFNLTYHETIKEWNLINILYIFNHILNIFYHFNSNCNTKF